MFLYILCLLLFGGCLVLTFLVLDLRMKCREYEIQVNSLKAEIKGTTVGTAQYAGISDGRENDGESRTSTFEKTETASGEGLSAAKAGTASEPEPTATPVPTFTPTPEPASEAPSGTGAEPQAPASEPAAETAAAASAEAGTAAQPAGAEPEPQAEPPAEAATAEIRMPADYPAIEKLEPGTILDPADVRGREDAMFAEYMITEGDAVYNRINGKSYRENPNIALSDLRYLKMIHYNFDHQIQVGEMIVNQSITEDVLHIFRELYDIGYEIQSMYLIDNYWAGDGDSSDYASIDVNNTSAFCYRTATGSGNLSNHAYGRAIDLNPQQNPYVSFDGNGSPVWYHRNADPYIDRNSGDPHVIVAHDACYNIFAKYGFSWGGNWASIKDYQHFEKKQ